jgi:ketosteroid isomerase-like protein
MSSPERERAVRLVGALHGARVDGNLPGMCRLFAADGLFEIAGASADKPIAISAVGLAQFRPWLMMMVKVFRLSDYRLLSLVVEGPKAVAHWRVDIHSKVTGSTVPTELVDLLEIRDGLIMNYSEFFVPRTGSGPVPRRFRE